MCKGRPACSDILKMILCLLLPPIAVLLDQGCNIQFLINIVLTILGYIPGIIHAIWAIWFRTPTVVYRGPV
uniref:Plasma membrane proteolipid 3 n=1 Tax=Plectus sambesii TaxID=2011161 RepID=A0A914VMW4_9BILA